MVESSALIRPYIAVLTRSELFVVMSCGMATTVRSVMVFYSIILQGVLDDPLGHIISDQCACCNHDRVDHGPGKKVVSTDEIEIGVEYGSLMDAITKGTYDGVRLMVSVGAMLLVLAALVTLPDSFWG